MRYDAVVVGAGPNGLAAAITFAQAGRSVVVLESADEVGGGLRSGPLVGEGYVNDLGSAIHPLGRASPFLASLDLQAHGLEWVTPPAAVGHPLDGGRAAIAWNDLDATVAGLGSDGAAYRAMAQPLITGFDKLLDLTMRPVLRVPPHPLFAARFGLQAIQPATFLARRRFRTEEGQALFAGHAAHSVLPLGRLFTASFGLLFTATPHVLGWPFPRGGAASLAAAMLAELRSLGGEVRTGVRVASLDDLPAADRVVFALTTMQVLGITGGHFPARFRQTLAGFRYGPGVFKLDYALSGPIPWSAPDLARTACVHVGGTLAEVAASEAAVGRGQHADRPFLILAQPSAFDPSRAPEGNHTGWVYCHVPNGSTVDMTAAIESQIERFAPGFRDVVISRHVMDPAALEGWNASLVGGDIAGGSLAGSQLLARPRWSLHPYATPDPRLFIGSASTPPGGGVHGMAGHQAALAAMA
ncbi:MAG TPA: NAD(P)/FAD-dependent oxidoreductase [Euzebya sp.]|nr:NAD(P)/FAD-dependent oxidoreductase [Euzebya sp.]